MKNGILLLAVGVASCTLVHQPAFAALDVPAEFYRSRASGNFAALSFLPKMTSGLLDRLNGASFSSLSVPLQRALLWDAGLVLSSDGSSYVQVQTKCGKTMSDIFLSMDSIKSAANCTIAICNAQILTFAYPNCSADNVASQTHCAIDASDAVGNAAVKTSSSLWSEEGTLSTKYNFMLFEYDTSVSAVNNSRVNTSTVLYTIYQNPTFQLLNDSTCPNAAEAFVVPCRSKGSGTGSVEESGWCPPTAGSLVTLWVTQEVNSVHYTADHSKWVQTSTIFIALFSIMCLVSGSFAYIFWRIRKTSTPYAVLGSNLNGNGYNANNGNNYNNLALTPGPTSTLSEPNTHSSQLFAIDKANEEYLQRSRELVAFCDDEELLVRKIDYDTLKFEKLIAKGANGEVWRGEYAGQFVAIKRLLTDIRSDVRAIEIFSREIRLGSSLEHPNIVRFIGLSWRSLAELSMVSEFLPMGDLARFLVSNESRALTWKNEKLSLASDIAKALVYLHSLVPVIIHRDLKSLNILLTATFEAKLSDFGLSRERSFEETMTMGVGTLLWTAPEVLRGDRYSEKADIYSYGIVLSELDTCLPPYSLNDEVGRLRSKSMDLLPLIRNGKIAPRFRPDCPPSVLTLAEACLNQNPDKRPNAMQIVYMLQSKVSMSL
ncbi:Tkl protein kinase [Globisporangium polare]